MKLNLTVLTATLIIIFFTTNLFAQDDYVPRWMISVKAGLNISSKSDDNIWGTRTGYNAGLNVDYNFSRLVFIRTGANINTKGASANHTSTDYLVDVEKRTYISHRHSELRYTMTYIQVPLDLGVRITINDNTSLSFIVGMYFENGVSFRSTYKDQYKKTYLDDNTQTESEFENKRCCWKSSNLKRFDMGANMAIETEYKHFLFGLSYERGLLDISCKANDSFSKWKNRNGSFYVGYKFFAK